MNHKQYDGPLPETGCQVSFMRREAGFSMPEPHFHDFYELYYLISGECRMFLNHTIYNLTAGDLMLIAPAQIHRVIYDSDGPAERYALFAAPEDLLYLKNGSDPAAFQHIFAEARHHLSAAERQRVNALFSQLEQENDRSDSFSALLVNSLLCELMVLLGRRQVPKAGEQDGNETDRTIQETARYLYQHHREPLSLNQASALAHMSPSHFSRHFKLATGFGFKEYLTHVRIQDAEHLLTTTKLSITEIALTCGFSDGNYFGDVFRRVRGMSPMQYRKSRDSASVSCYNK